MKRLIGIACVLIFMAIQACAAEYGEQIAWMLDDVSGVMTISGTGPMTDYPSRASVPWFAEGRTAQIRSVVVGKGITRIGSFSFYDCTQMESIVLPSTLTSIGNRAFHSCSSLKEIVLPEGIERIEAYTFYKCTSLTKIVLPTTLQTVESKAFEGCSALKTVIYGGNETQAQEINIGEDNAPFLAAEWHYSREETLTTLQLPASLTIVCAEALSGTAAQMIVIPSSCQMVEKGAFSGCTNLKKIVNLSGVVFDAPEGVEIVEAE